MAIETDADGYSADGFQISPTSTCALCNGDDAGWEIEGLVMHLQRWWQSTAASRPIAAGTAGAPAELAPAREAPSSVAVAHKAPAVRTKVLKEPSKQNESAFSGPEQIPT